MTVQQEMNVNEYWEWMILTIQAKEQCKGTLSLIQSCKIDFGVVTMGCSVD